MAYVAVAKALYDYEAQDPQDELTFKEDQVLYILEKEDEQWWKAKIKPGEDGAEIDKVGLVPSNYVEEAAPIGYSKALYEYEATAEDEISIAEDAALIVYDEADEWTLVAIQGATPHEGGRLGFVPTNYIEPPTPNAAEVGVSGEAAEGMVTEDEVHEVEPSTTRSDPGASAGLAPGRKDSIETWSIQLMDKKKKKKGTLGVGNGAVFFASESDKTPVQQFPMHQLTKYSSPSSKTLLLSFTTTSDPLEFHTSSKDITEAILAKLESSKAISGSGSGFISTEREVGGLNRGVTVSSEDGDEQNVTSPTASAKAVRWAEPSSAALPPPPVHHARTSSAQSVPKASPAQVTATALYDFDAQGDDELPVTEGEILTVIDKSNDDWWTVKNSRGKQGVVPAQYVELNASDAAQSAATGRPVESDTDDEEDERVAQIAREQERARALEAERADAARTAKLKEEEILRQVQEEARRAEEERIKREKREKRRAEEEKRRREQESARRREAGRSGGPPEPPKLRQRPSESDVAAARALPNPKGRSQPDRPKDTNKNRPNPARTRVWHDKTGQFRVEAEFLGLGNGKIRLHKINGVIIEVPVEKMSPDDIAYIKRERRQNQASRAAPASRSPPLMDPEDDLPLARMSRPQSTGGGPSAETRARSSPTSNPVASVVQQRPRKAQFDWFEFFLSAGCDIDDCTRYAANFERDRIDESILPDLEPSTLRSLGLREGDVIRVRKAISNKFRDLTPEQKAQIKEDEELARKLQEAENSGRGIPANLFTQSDGKLANNTRRGRPEPRERKGTASSIDPSSIGAAADKLKETNGAGSPPLLSPSPPPAPVAVAEPVKAAPLISGFDDDAWVPRPNSTKPATPTPPAPPAPPAPAPVISAPQPQQTSSTLANQINNLHLTTNQNAQQSSNSNTDFLSEIPSNRIVQPQQTGMGVNSGLGMGSSNMPMGQLLTAQQTGAYGQQQPQSPATGSPLAPIPANQGLLNPLVPTQTGFNGFVPTRNSPALSPNQQSNQMMPQATGYNMNMSHGNTAGMGMMPQQTGFNQYGQQQGGFQGMQPNMTGFNGMQQQPNPMFNALASVPTQQTSNKNAQSNDRFAPQSIFANMKRGEIVKSEHEAPQSSDKYDALRPQPTGALMPLATGYNGGMMPQQTGMPMGYMNNMNTGMGMNSMNTGMGMGMGMNMTGMPGQQQQQPGYMNMQQTGYMGQNLQGGYRY